MRSALHDGWQTLRTRLRTLHDRWQVVLAVGFTLTLVAGAATIGWREIHSSLDLVAGVLAFLLVLKAAEILVVFGSRLVR